MRIDPALRPGLCFMTFHFPDQVDTNQLTIDATDPKSRHGRVQGRRRAGREAAAVPARAGSRAERVLAEARTEWTCTSSTPSRRGAERAAVDARARPAGGAAGTAARARRRRRATLRDGGHDARARSATCCCRRCCALQEHVGWISPGALNYVCRRLTVPPADVYGVATFYALLAVEPRPPRVVHVCEDLACRCHGSQELIAQLEERVGAEGEPPPTAPRPGSAARASASATARRRRC